MTPETKQWIKEVKDRIALPIKCGQSYFFNYSKNDLPTAIEIIEKQEEEIKWLRKALVYIANISGGPTGASDSCKLITMRSILDEIAKEAREALK